MEYGMDETTKRVLEEIHFREKLSPHEEAIYDRFVKWTMRMIKAGRTQELEKILDDFKSDER